MNGHMILYEWGQITSGQGGTFASSFFILILMYVLYIYICNVGRECYQSIISPGSFNKVPVIIMKLEMAISKKYKTIFMRLYLKSEVMTGQNFEKNAALSTHIVQI